MATECTAYTEYIVTPNIHMKAIAITYTKTNATDYITASAYGIKTIRFATAKVTATGADDPCTWATGVLTFTTGTGAGAALIVGSG